MKENCWLCCGSTQYDRHDRFCIEKETGHPEHCRWGTAEEHSAWQKQGRSQAMKRPTDQFVAAAFWQACEAKHMYTDHFTFMENVKSRARELQSAADNPSRTKCPKCPNMMVNPRPCMNPDCGFRK